MSLLILPCPNTGQQSLTTTGPLRRAHLSDPDLLPHARRAGTRPVGGLAQGRRSYQPTVLVQTHRRWVPTALATSVACIWRHGVQYLPHQRRPLVSIYPTKDDRWYLPTAV